MCIKSMLLMSHQKTHILPPDTPCLWAPIESSTPIVANPRQPLWLFLLELQPDCQFLHLTF